MSKAAADTGGRIFERVSAMQGMDVTPAFVERLREDLAVVRYTLNHTKNSAEARRLEAALKALAKARGDRASEMERLKDALYGIRMILPGE